VQQLQTVAKSDSEERTNKNAQVKVSTSMLAPTDPRNSSLPIMRIAIVLRPTFLSLFALTFLAELYYANPHLFHYVYVKITFNLCPSDLRPKFPKQIRA
jgi:hypothetical protein